MWFQLAGIQDSHAARWRRTTWVARLPTCYCVPPMRTIGLSVGSPNCTGEQVPHEPLARGLPEHREVRAAVAVVVARHRRVGRVAELHREEVADDHCPVDGR